MFWILDVGFLDDGRLLGHLLLQCMDEFAETWFDSCWLMENGTMRIARTLDVKLLPVDGDNTG